MRIAGKGKREKPKDRFKVKRKALEEWREKDTNTEVGSRREVRFFMRVSLSRGTGREVRKGAMRLFEGNR